MGKKFWIATVVATVLFFFLDWIIHGMILSGMYTMPGMREAPMMLWLVVGEFFFAAAFTWIYAQGYEAAKPVLGQGIRYGLAVGVLVGVSWGFVMYALHPVSWGYVITMMALALVELAVVGAAVAMLIGPRGGGAPSPAPAM
ncbi:MAG: hypothetical protein ACREKI_05715 [Gemmatimonadota bacterium]